MMHRFQWMTLAALVVLLAGAGPAAARVDVVAANQDLAWLARAIGGSQVSVEYLASSSQDPHAVEPRPSQVLKLSRADMVVRIGMDLDLWFDALIRAAGNSKILPGARGYVDASRGMQALEVPAGKLDPSHGDIHAYGNPHYFFGPSRLATAARNVRDGLKRVDSAHAGVYDAGYNSLVARLNEAMPRWKATLARARGKSVVAYHKSLAYFLADFGLKELGTVEPKPGLSPTPGHISGVARAMKESGCAVILTEHWRSRRYADLLARQAGAKLVVLPGGIGAEKGLDDYFSFMDAWVNRVAAAL